MSAVASILIPTYQHAQYIREAVDSALAQTVPVEVIVVDDGSTDDTPAVLASYGDRIRVLSLPHGGPSAARNAGLDAATGEFVMLLDADDVIAPTKVAQQLSACTDEIGWVLCDVEIQDEIKGRTIKASDQYGYAKRELGGWIEPQLRDGNFIPIMAPLVRRSVLGGIRFDDTKVPEDFHFWSRVAAQARVRYVSAVLATYRHRRTGRSRLPKKARTIMPNIEQPIRLNLGCGTPDTRSWHPMRGLVNLDKSIGWTFEEGLGDFVDRSVAGITVSHALMYVAESDWPAVFNEFARVLAPGGVLRITEDETVDPRSERVGGWKGSQPAVTLTSPALVQRHLEAVGLTAHRVSAEKTRYRDRSLMQAQHGPEPNVFFMEGVKPVGVLFAPHNDDETLFAAFTILKHRPAIVVCYPSTGDYGDPKAREDETRDAMSVLGGGPVEQWQGGDLVARMRAYDERCRPTRVWAPDVTASHPDHVAVAKAASEVFAGRVTSYHTYDLARGGKVRVGSEVAYQPEWVHKKLRAMARYETQATHPRAHQFFVDDLREYIEEAGS